MRRRLSLLLVLALCASNFGCGGGCTGPARGVNKDFDRPTPTPPTTR